MEIFNSGFPRLAGRTGLASIILVYLSLVLTLPSQFSPAGHSCIPGGSSGKWLPARLPRLPRPGVASLVLGPVTSGFGGIPFVVSFGMNKDHPLG